jgi:hypothetical protein
LIRFSDRNYVLEKMMRWRSESLGAAALPKRTQNTPAANVQNGRRNEGISHQRVFLAVNRVYCLPGDRHDKRNCQMKSGR